MKTRYLVDNYDTIAFLFRMPFLRSRIHNVFKKDSRKKGNEHFFPDSLPLVSYAAVLCLVTQRSSPRRGGALRDETKNGCVGDYPSAPRR